MSWTSGRCSSISRWSESAIKRSLISFTEWCTPGPWTRDYEREEKARKERGDGPLSERQKISHNKCRPQHLHFVPCTQTYRMSHKKCNDELSQNGVWITMKELDKSSSIEREGKDKNLNLTLNDFFSRSFEGQFDFFGRTIYDCEWILSNHYQYSMKRLLRLWVSNFWTYTRFPVN